jgi:hypothetical protein
MHTVVNAFDVNPIDLVEIALAGRLEAANVGDSRAVYENVNALLPQDLRKRRIDAGAVGDVAGVTRGRAALLGNLPGNESGRVALEVDYPDGRSVSGKPARNGSANSTAAAGYDGGFAVQLKASGGGGAQSDTPRFQGMKSSCRSNSALVRTSPLATRME